MQDSLLTTSFRNSQTKKKKRSRLDKTIGSEKGSYAGCGFRTVDGFSPKFAYSFGQFKSTMGKGAGWFKNTVLASGTGVRPSSLGDKGENGVKAPREKGMVSEKPGVLARSKTNHCSGGTKVCMVPGKKVIPTWKDAPVISLRKNQEEKPDPLGRRVPKLRVRDFSRIEEKPDLYRRTKTYKRGGLKQSTGNRKRE